MFRPGNYVINQEKKRQREEMREFFVKNAQAVCVLRVFRVIILFCCELNLLPKEILFAAARMMDSPSRGPYLSCLDADRNNTISLSARILLS